MVLGIGGSAADPGGEKTRQWEGAGRWSRTWSGGREHQEGRVPCRLPSRTHREVSVQGMLGDGAEEAARKGVRRRKKALALETRWPGSPWIRVVSPSVLMGLPFLVIGDG